jgi:hypothetical protein
MSNFSIRAWLNDFSCLTCVHGLFSHPARNLVRSESPVGTDSEARNLALSDQRVNCGRVHSQ